MNLGNSSCPAAPNRSVAMRQTPCPKRRRLLQLLALLGISSLVAPSARSAPRAILTRAIPSTGETLPVVGLGSWITFNVGDDAVARDACAEVMRTFFEAGGRMIDSSPMYGSSQEVIGYGLRKARRLAAARLRGRQGLDLLGRARPRADRGVAPALARAALRSAAGPQPARLAGAPADAVRDEGGGPAALCRHHDIGRPAPSRDRAASCAASRSTSCRSPTTSVDREVGSAHPAAGARARHRGDRQPAVPRRAR